MQSELKERVLLVDDELQVLVALEDTLAEHFIVLKAQSGEEALAIAEADHDLAVIITDQRMPRMTGDQLLTSLVKSSEAVRILVTGFADVGAVSRAVNDGRIFAYVTKPWNPDELLFKVQSAADQFRLTHELVKERQFLHDLMDNTLDGIYLKDESLRILRANRSFAAMLGQDDPRSLVGKKLGELVPEPMHVVDSDFEESRVVSEGVPLTDVTRTYNFGGHDHWISETKAAVRSPRGHLVGLVGVARDVTKQRALEAQLAQSQRLEAIVRFAGSVAHDFNNLLAVILSYAELSHAELGPESPISSDILQIVEAAKRGAGLTRHLLSFSRRQFIQPRPFNPDAVVANMEAMLRRLIGEDIALSVATFSSGAVLADPGQFEQIALNLVVNARDSMPRGGRLTIATADVTLDATYTDGHPGVSPGPFVALSVTDTGSGMDAVTQKRIFEPFFTTKEAGKGTGLGLATVYGIVKQSGGHIAVYSELGRGTCFKVYLPRVDAQPQEEAPAEPRVVVPASSGTVLVLEDDEDVRRVAARILSKQGFTVLESSRPSEARALLREHGPTLTLLLTDLVLPESGGTDFAREVTLEFPQVKVLYMSGYPEPATVSWSIQSHSYLEKPFTPRLLLDKVRTALAVP